MSGLNKVMLIGNLGADPDLRETGGGTKVANFRVATSSSWKDKDTGERKEETEWHNVVCWRNLASVVERFVKKGSKVYIEGRMKTRSYEVEGVKRYVTEVIADELQLLDKPTKPEAVANMEEPGTP